MFQGILIEKDDAGYRSTIQEIDEKSLPEGSVTVEVEYSSINYKDALAITGRGPVVRSFPMVPGIDLAGTVVESLDPNFGEGQQVIHTGWGVGESRWGGLAQKARLKGEWLVSKPDEFTPSQTMAIGTAGLTAMLCVMAVEKHGIKPGDGDVLVTGAGGGVGGSAVSLLAKLGYSVVAVTGRADKEADYLTSLGASSILHRDELAAPGKPLGKERWVAAIDVVGSTTLANICAQTCYNGIVAACGLAGGMDLPATVAPFILRGVTLRGIDSVMCPNNLRQKAWNRLARDLDQQQLTLMTREISLDDAIVLSDELLSGKVRGRLVVKI
jgi:acrylyl-CoA reductase (NADPH)